ncbi:MAG TPA: alpha-glucan family phosphorylase [Verrucomicrobiae bacterium]|nr:alpha-glucan family phosphorylase [Verrucomicrobiae bacterium]
MKIRDRKRGAAVSTRVQKGSRLVAYFCAEYGINDATPIYSGGLGVLAGDIVQEAAEQKLPVAAIGLFYRKGYFHQHVDTKGQHEFTTTIDPVASGLELIRDKDGETVLIEVPIAERIVYVQIWRWKLGSTVNLYLLDTDHWKNSAEDRAITDQLYSGDQAKRIEQEIVLGIGGFRALRFMKYKPEVYHMNEGHSAFLSLELVSSLMRDQDIPSEHARKIAKGCLRFTNHTLVAAGNDAFSHTLVRSYLTLFAAESGLTMSEIINWGNAPEQPNSFSMTMLALRMAGVSTAVSRLHAEKALSLWPHHPLVPITNGVFLPGWIAPELQKLYAEFAPEWRPNAADPKVWRGVRRMPHERLWEVHMTLKRRMLAEVELRTGMQMDERALTIVWARRFATYKRPDLLFSDLNRLKKFIFRSDRPIQIIVAGKAHPADTQGKEIIQKIEDLALTELQGKVVFLEDYSISLSRLLVSGADIWLNTPVFGLEASGTSGMKASANGVVQVTVSDGWAHEVDWYGMGYELPAEGAEKAIYSILERKAIPTFFRRNHDDVPELWVAMMLETIASVSPAYSSARMVHDYTRELYDTQG